MGQVIVRKLDEAVDPAELDQIASDIAGPFQRLVPLDRLLSRAATADA